MAGLPSAFTQRLAPEPGNHPDHRHGCCRQELLEVRAREAKVSTLAEINAPDPLRKATLHPCPQRVLCCELRRLLALPRGLERLMVDWWADRELAGGCLGGGARLAGGTRATGAEIRERDAPGTGADRSRGSAAPSAGDGEVPWPGKAPRAGRGKGCRGWGGMVGKGETWGGGLGES